MDRILRLTLLYDYYGELLTEHQKEIFTLYHLHDLSMQEIGDELHTSRQSVNDLLKRTEKLLEDYEDKLSLLSQAEKRRANIQEIMAIMDRLADDQTVPEEQLLAIRTQLLAIDELS